MRDFEIKIYSTEEIAEMYDTWKGFFGFHGVRCYECKVTANIFFGGASWVCEKGHLNILSSGACRPPYEAPDFGTPLKTIREGWKKSNKYKEWEKENLR